MNKLTKDYLLLTFMIMLTCWGTCALCSINGILLKENSILYVPYMLGGFSPFIASYISMKKNNKVRGLKEWFRNALVFKKSFTSYLMVFVLDILFILPQIIILDYEKGEPLFAIVYLVPMMLVGGGIEEFGWRYVLQPELEKKCSFILSTLIVGIIWSFWHLPLFFIEGVSQYNQNFLAFGLFVLGLSFALAAIRKNTNSIWLCALFHSIVNSLSSIFIVEYDIITDLVVVVVLIVASLLFVKMNEKGKLFGSLSSSVGGTKN